MIYPVVHFLVTLSDPKPRFQGHGVITDVGEHIKIVTPYLFLQPLKLTTSNLVYNLGLGSNLPRNNFYDQNGGPGLGAFKKFGTPYLFLVQLKLETSNLVYDLGLRVDYQETTFTTEIGGESGVGQHPKKLKTPYLFLQPLKLATSNLVYHMGMASSVPETTVRA